MRTFVGAILLAGLVGACAALSPPVVASCEPSYTRPDWGQLAMDLERAKTLWNAQDAHTYVYTNTVRTFGRTFETRVEVQNDVVVRVRDVRTGESYMPESARTITGLFGSLHSTITRGRADPMSCLTLSVTYDATGGFPTRIDSGNATAGLQDAFESVQISQFSRPMQE